MLLDIDSIDRETKTIHGASLSSDTPIEHVISGQMVPVQLVHEPDAVELPRSIPLLWQHDMSQPIGKIDNFSIDRGKIRGRFSFSNNSKAQEVWRDIEDGFLSDTSVKAVPDEYDDEDDLIRVTKWHLIEGSVVTIGADSTVGLDRAITTEEKVMTDETVTRNTGEPEPGSGEVNVLAFDAARKAATERRCPQQGG